GLVACSALPTRRSSDLIVLITGANRGLGYETARQLAKRGWTILLGARNPERGRVAAEKLAAEGGDVRAVTIDVTDNASVNAAVEDRKSTRLNSSHVKSS